MKVVDDDRKLTSRSPQTSRCGAQSEVLRGIGGGGGDLDLNTGDLDLNTGDLDLNTGDLDLNTGDLDLR